VCVILRTHTHFVCHKVVYLLIYVTRKCDTPQVSVTDQVPGVAAGAPVCACVRVCVCMCVCVCACVCGVCECANV